MDRRIIQVRRADWLGGAKQGHTDHGMGHQLLPGDSQIVIKVWELVAKPELPWHAPIQRHTLDLMLLTHVTQFAVHCDFCARKRMDSSLPSKANRAV